MNAATMMPMNTMPNTMMSGMMPMLMPMMCQMTIEMGKDGMTCKMTPIEGMSIEMMTERCEAMMKLMAMGMPIMMCMPSTAK